MKLPSQRPTISQHRFARYVLWAQLMLAWVAVLLVAPNAARRRHMRQRWGLVSATALSRLVRHLIVARAVALAGGCARRPSTPRDFAGAGFRRRMRLGNLARAAAGAALRRALRHREGARHMAILLEALDNIDTHAVALLRRFRRGLTRLRPLMLVRSPRCAHATSPAPAPAAPDTS